MNIEDIKSLLIGLFITGIVLVLEGYLTTTQFGFFIQDLQTALMASLALSIILFIIFISLSVYTLFYMKKPLYFVGGLIGIVLAYALFAVVREGFAVFFEFI